MMALLMIECEIMNELHGPSDNTWTLKQLYFVPLSSCGPGEIQIAPVYMSKGLRRCNKHHTFLLYQATIVIHSSVLLQSSMSLYYSYPSSKWRWFGLQDHWMSVWLYQRTAHASWLVDVAIDMWSKGQMRLLWLLQSAMCQRRFGAMPCLHVWNTASCILPSQAMSDT